MLYWVEISKLYQRLAKQSKKFANFIPTKEFWYSLKSRKQMKIFYKGQRTDDAYYTCVCAWVTQCTCATTGAQIPLPSLNLTTQRKKKAGPRGYYPAGVRDDDGSWRERFHMWRHLLLCGIESVIHTLKGSRWSTDRSTAPFLFVTMRALFLSADPVPCTHFHAHFPFSHAVILYDKYKSCFNFKERRKRALMRQTCSGIWRKSLWLFSIP